MLADLGIVASATRPTTASVGNAPILKALIHLLPVQWAHDPDQPRDVARRPSRAGPVPDSRRAGRAGALALALSPNIRNAQHRHRPAEAHRQRHGDPPVAVEDQGLLAEHTGLAGDPNVVRGR